MDAPTTRYATTDDGISIAYVVAGSGPHLFYWPDACHCHAEGYWRIPRFREAYEQMATSYTLVMHDPRGSGLSDRDLPDGPTRTLEAQLQDFDAVLKAVNPEPFALIAHGPGTLAAVRYAAHHGQRVAALVLINPFQRGSDFMATPSVQSIHSYREVSDVDWEGYCRTLAYRWSAYERETAEAVAQVMIGASTPQANRQALSDIATIDVSEDVPGITVPTLILVARGEGSPSDRQIRHRAAREIAARIPRAQVATFDRTQPKLVPADAWSIVRGFLDRAVAQSKASGANSTASPFRTILFTDVVASTPLLAQLKDAKMREVMREHDEVMTAAVTGHGGRVVKTIGDAFMAEFAVPSAAVEAAIEAQRAIRERFAHADVPVRLRIGINAGEPIEEGGDLHGTSVVIAKRLESAADVNGILVSDVVRQAVAGKEFHFEDRGLLALKGFDEPVGAWAVRWEDD